MSESQKQVVVKRLQEYEEQFTTLLDLIGERRQLDGPDKVRARKLLSELKANLSSESKDLQRNRDRLSTYESAFLEPAISEARAHLTTRVNTIPGREWHAEVYAARIDITYMLSQLQSKE